MNQSNGSKSSSLSLLLESAVEFAFYLAFVEAADLEATFEAAFVDTLAFVETSAFVDTAALFEAAA